MVGLCAVAFAMTGPGQTTGVSVFIDPMMQTLSLSRTEIATAYLVGTLVSSATLPRLGGLVDRFGARVAMAMSGGLLGVALVAMAGVNGLVALAVGFTAIRMFGQGALHLVATNAVAPWFDRRRGMAMGISSAVGSALIALIPIGSEPLIQRFGWRSTWLVLACTVWVIVLPIALRGIVDHPELIGQVPDGAAAPRREAPSVRGVQQSYTRRQALATPMYWAIAASALVISTISTGLVFHQMSVLGEQGLTRIEAAANFLPQTVGTLVATVWIGTLVDRIGQRWLIVGNMALLAVVMLMVPSITPGPVSLLYGLLLGGAAGANRIFEAAATARLFGLGHLGAIRGVTRFVLVAGSAVGPLLVAFGHDLTGSYQEVLRWLLVAPVGVMVLAMLAPVPAALPPSASTADS